MFFSSYFMLIVYVPFWGDPMEDSVIRQREGVNASQPMPVPCSGISSTEALRAFESYVRTLPAFRPILPLRERSGAAGTRK